ncbi:MAG: hypothetical protein Fur0010_04590 [Bdellovibrio sp.]
MLIQKAIILLASLTITLSTMAETRPRPRPVNLVDPNQVKNGPRLHKTCVGCEDPLQGLSSGFFDDDADCTNFISREGTYGPWGRHIIEYLNALGDNSHMFKNNIPGMVATKKGETAVCPKWNELSLTQRKHFWVWVFASLAWDESTCRANARNPNATNGVAVGLLQLEEAKSKRSWRGPNCRADSVADARTNLRCGLDIMTELMKGKNGEYESNGKLYPTSSYWANFRSKKGGDAGALIREFSACR